MTTPNAPCPSAPTGRSAAWSKARRAALGGSTLPWGERPRHGASRRRLGCLSDLPRKSPIPRPLAVQARAAVARAAAVGLRRAGHPDRAGRHQGLRLREGVPAAHRPRGLGTTGEGYDKSARDRPRPKPETTQKYTRCYR
eukprot:scaffold114153_cov69-Phaeocystis_antarctica.AAC.9